MAIDERILLTPQGKEELKHEHDNLRQVKRPLLLERIQELSSEGDVSDNSEYEDVKEELIQFDSRIREIEHILTDAEVVEHAHVPTGVVAFGATVTLVDCEGIEEAWTLVGPQEANARLGRISNVSPVGSALLGKRIGDTVVVKAPGGETRYAIKDVR